ncbi:MAG: hypothetical protein MK214_07535 [Thalassotalea sp.]|nr:hypothetical protein [Thalassotalea sp.]
MDKVQKYKCTVGFRFNDSSVLFCSHTGKTHVVEDSALELLEEIPEEKAISIESILHKISIKYPHDDKELLSQYISDIIKSLIDYEIISCKQ